MNNDVLLHGSLILLLAVCAGFILKRNRLTDKRTDERDDEHMHWL